MPEYSGTYPISSARPHDMSYSASGLASADRDPSTHRESTNTSQGLRSMRAPVSGW